MQQAREERAGGEQDEFLAGQRPGPPLNGTSAQLSRASPEIQRSGSNRSAPGRFAPSRWKNQLATSTAVPDGSTAPSQVVSVVVSRRIIGAVGHRRSDSRTLARSRGRSWGPTSSPPISAGSCGPRRDGWRAAPAPGCSTTRRPRRRTASGRPGRPDRCPAWWGRRSSSRPGCPARPGRGGARRGRGTARRSWSTGAKPAQFTDDRSRVSMSVRSWSSRAPSPNTTRRTTRHQLVM